MAAGIAAVAVGLTGKHIQHAWVIDAFGAVFVLIAIVMFIFTKSDTLVADKGARQLSVRFSSLKNRQGTEQQCSFDDVQAVQLQQSYQQQYTGNNAGMGPTGGGLRIGIGASSGGNTQTEILMNLSVLLKNGTVWTIANEQHQAGMGLGISSNALVGKGQKLAAALGVTFQQVGAETLGQAVTGIRQALSGLAPGASGTFVASASPAPAPNVDPAASQPAGGSDLTSSPASPIPTASAAPVQPPVTETQTPASSPERQA